MTSKLWGYLYFDLTTLKKNKWRVGCEGRGVFAASIYFTGDELTHYDHWPSSAVALSLTLVVAVDKKLSCAPHIIFKSILVKLLKINIFLHGVQEKKKKKIMHKRKQITIIFLDILV